jgi:hypothetical protein
MQIAFGLVLLVDHDMEYIQVAAPAAVIAAYLGAEASAA